MWLQNWDHHSNAASATGYRVVVLTALHLEAFTTLNITNTVPLDFDVGLVTIECYTASVCPLLGLISPDIGTQWIAIA
jgi:hypothetical protein